MPKTRRCDKKRRIKKQHGGEFLGEGAFGAVYGNPRLQCKDETDKDDFDNTVSKIFKKDDEEDAKSEINVLTRLEQHMNYYDVKELRKKYALLPIKKCKIDEKSLANEPYKTDAWKIRTQNDKIVRSKHFFKDANSTVEHDASLVIYDKGGDNLSTVFKTLQNSTNINEFYQVLIKLTNILEAIQILQKNDFIHGDIKPGNCIVDKDGNYRLIDMADMNYISSPAYKGKNMPTAFMYFAWPSTVLYSYFFRYPVHKDNKININQFKSRFNGFNNSDFDFNIEQFHWITQYFSVFDSFPDIEFDGNTNGYYKDILVKQKTFGINENEELFSESNIENIKTHLSEFNEFFAEPRPDLKLDLFKRCDIYSFGIMILVCIGNAKKILELSMIEETETSLSEFRMIENAQTNLLEFSVIEKTQTLLTNLFKFVWMCCYQDEKVRDINELVAFWKETIVLPITPSKLEKENSKSDLVLDKSPPKGCFGKACEVASSVFGFTRRRGGSKYKRNHYRKVRQTHKNRRR